MLGLSTHCFRKCGTTICGLVLNIGMSKQLSSCAQNSRPLVKTNPYVNAENAMTFPGDQFPQCYFGKLWVVVPCILKWGYMVVLFVLWFPGFQTSSSLTNVDEPKLIVNEDMSKSFRSAIWHARISPPPCATVGSVVNKLKRSSVLWLSAPFLYLILKSNLASRHIQLIRRPDISAVLKNQLSKRLLVNRVNAS